MDALFASPFFGIALSIGAFLVGVQIQKKTGLVICNPLIIAIVLVCAVLLLFHIPYDSYNEGGAMISLFLSPATACLAVSIYTKAALLKEYWLPILAGCAAGSLASMGSVWVLCRLFGLDEAVTASLLPKSVTTPIATSIAESHGGLIPITVVAVIFTGILGSILAPALIKLFRVKDPVVAGLAIGYRPGPGAGRDRGGHERPGHRRMRHPDGAVFAVSYVKTTCLWAANEGLPPVFLRRAFTLLP